MLREVATVYDAPFPVSPHLDVHVRYTISEARRADPSLLTEDQLFKDRSATETKVALDLAVKTGEEQEESGPICGCLARTWGSYTVSNI